MRNIEGFLNNFFEQIEKIGLDVDSLVLDHVAFQASTSKDYENRKIDFEKFGKEVSEEMVGGRRVAIYELFSSIKFKHYLISTLEIIEPKEGQNPESGFQHAEFVISVPFEEYIKNYPEIKWDTTSIARDEFAHLKLNFDNGLTLKFCENPILNVVRSK